MGQPANKMWFNGHMIDSICATTVVHLEKAMRVGKEMLALDGATRRAPVCSE